MFPLLRVSGSLHVWQESYCDADYQKCHRYECTSRGRPVAPDLLPNGVRLGDLRKGQAE